MQPSRPDIYAPPGRSGNACASFAQVGNYILPGQSPENQETFL